MRCVFHTENYLGDSVCIARSTHNLTPREGVFLGDLFPIAKPTQQSSQGKLQFSNEYHRSRAIQGDIQHCTNTSVYY